jgi:hypothetical protein
MDKNTVKSQQVGRRLLQKARKVGAGNVAGRRLGLSNTQVSQQQARRDMTALMTAKFIELATGNSDPLFETVQMLINSDADRMAGCMLTCVNLLVAFVSDNGENMNQFKDFNDFLIKSLASDDPIVARIAQEHG